MGSFFFSWLTKNSLCTTCTIRAGLINIVLSSFFFLNKKTNHILKIYKNGIYDAYSRSENGIIILFLVSCQHCVCPRAPIDLSQRHYNGFLVPFYRLNIINIEKHDFFISHTYFVINSGSKQLHIFSILHIFVN